MKNLMKLTTIVMVLSIAIAPRVTAQSGCTAADSSPNHHNGTFVGNPAPECVQGISGTALSFNGQNYVEIPNSPDFNLAEMTLEAWIKSSNTQFGSVVSTDDDNFQACGTTGYNITGNEFDQRITAAVGARCGTGGGVMSLNALNDNQWHHLAMTLGGGFVKFYVDGALQGSTATSNQPTNTLAPLRIGLQKTHGGRFWHGLIDEVRLSKVVRYAGNFTPQQSYTVDSSTVGYWSFGVCDSDTTPPTILCPDNIVATNDSGQCSAVVSYTATASDDCSGIASLSEDFPSGSSFPAGATTVTVTAVDGSGNSNSCSFTVTVVDGGAPRVACRPAPNPSGKISVPGKNGSTGVNPSGYYQLLAKDDCDPDPAIYVKDIGSTFVAGPFNDGDIVRLKHTGGTPSSSPGTPPVVAIINLNGNGLAIATDASGNVTPDANGCLVQP